MPDLIHLFSLNTSSSIPIYRQLIDQINQAIRMGLLQPNQQLPSVRALASALQINPMTISKAFNQLEHDGVLIRKRGIGMLINQNSPSRTISAALESSLKEYVQLAQSESLSHEETLSLVQQYLSIKNDEK